MTGERIHRAVSDDGTEIAGRVHGQGPPLVLVHGGLGDGELSWNELLPHLTDRFTCYLPSTRGRGLSADNPDHSPPRLIEDVAAFVDSIGEPAFLVSTSGDGQALGAAADSGAVTAVAAYEPMVGAVMREDDLVGLGALMEQVGMAAADGRLVDAARAFAPAFCTDHEITALEETDFFERWAGGIPAMLRFLQEDASYEGPRATDPEVLARITVPVLILRGQQTLLGTLYADSQQHVAQHAADRTSANCRALGTSPRWSHPNPSPVS
jgi:pimeloyl-ACP methyl ester carboxylesterase